jgi:hypothetical protein
VTFSIPGACCAERKIFCFRHHSQILFANPLQTDASLNGSGAECSQISIGGRWTVDESKNHINYLVLLAIFLGLKAFF